jgi:hypothetical protein
MKVSLIEYIVTLDTDVNTLSLYVDPDNVDDYAIGQDYHENGGVDDRMVRADTLSEASFGYQYQRKIFRKYIHSMSESLPPLPETTLLLNPNESDDRLNVDKEFKEFFNSRIESILNEWALNRATKYVGQLKNRTESIPKYAKERYPKGTLGYLKEKYCPDLPSGCEYL